MKTLIVQCFGLSITVMLVTLCLSILRDDVNRRNSAEISSLYQFKMTLSYFIKQIFASLLAVNMIHISASLDSHHLHRSTGFINLSYQIKKSIKSNITIHTPQDPLDVELTEFIKTSVRIVSITEYEYC